MWRYFGFLVVLFIMSSCFKKEEKLPPIDFNGQAFVFNESVYETQFFYNLEKNKIIRKNSNSKWDLSFENGKNRRVVRINNSNLIEVWPTGIYDFNVSNFPNTNRYWLYDKSDGSEDSLAIRDWVEGNTEPYSYTNQVYLIGIYNGTHNHPFKKIVFTLVNDSIYQFKYADMDGNNEYIRTIQKDTTYNRVYFSFLTNDTVIIEPPKYDWDLEFTNYSTTLFTADKIPVFYPVRGVLINSNKIQAAVDSTLNYYSISRDDISNINYSSNWDIIGYDWKSVIINEQSNTAEYFIRPKNNYLIKVNNGKFYKFKFISFYNESKAPGYPSFIFNNL